MLPLTLGAGAGLAVSALLVPTTGTALGDLAAARDARSQLARAAAQPERHAPLIAVGAAIGAPDAAAGRAAMMARLRRLSVAGGVLVEQAGAAEAPDGLVAMHLRVSGAEKAVLALADALERERPVIRFRSWSLGPVAGGVRLTAEAVAAQ